MDSGLNFIDLLLIIIVMLSAWSGWRKGFIIGALELITWIGSFIAALAFYKYPAVVIEQYFSLGDWTLPVAFVLILIIMRILF
ncbi:MAG: CvpA family protein, partial [Bacteroidota bacterium]|nr:CvpA family protein [Bacteroidota bacterium]